MLKKAVNTTFLIDVNLQHFFILFHYFSKIQEFCHFFDKKTLFNIKLYRRSS